MVDVRLKPGWRRVKFDELAENVNDRVDDPRTSGVDRYVGLEHLDSGTLKIRRWGTPTDVEATKLRFRSGDIIFGRRRAYQRKVAVADFDGICSAHALVLRERRGSLVPGLLPFFMQSNAFTRRAVAISVGSLSPTINWSSLREEAFVIPPPEHQRRLTVTFHHAQELLDTLDNSNDVLRGLYQSASMHMFCRAAAVSISSPQGWMRSDWSCSPLEEFTSPDATISYGIVQPGDSTPGGVPTLTSNNLNIGFDSGLHYTAPQIEGRYSRTRVIGGDILITVKGFGTGKIGVVPPHFSGNITRDLARIRLDDRIERRFFVHLWRNPAFRHYWGASSVGSTRPELSIGVLRSLMIPHPGIDQQIYIADLLDEIETAAREVISRRAKVQELATQLANQNFPDTA